MLFLLPLQNGIRLRTASGMNKYSIITLTELNQIWAYTANRSNRLSTAFTLEDGYETGNASLSEDFENDIG
ncbi:hypothetical protein D3C76_1719980 [compost metagenome]